MSRKRRKKSLGGTISKWIVVAVILGLLVWGGIAVKSCVDEFKGRNLSEETVTVTIREEDGLETIVQKLVDAGVIRHEKVFLFYANTKNLARGFRIGEIRLSVGMGYGDLLTAILKPVVVQKPRKTVTIRFKDASNVVDVVALFVKNGIGTQAEFDTLLATSDFGGKYDWIPEPGTPNRMEGLLFPDTYEFFADSTPEEAINKMLANFDKKVVHNERVQNALKNSDLSLYEALILGSIIQREAALVSEMPTISSVFHNRLAISMKLQSDVTILPADRFENAEQYDTYTIQGLPPTPICTPTLAAVLAALEPETTPYYYFYATGPQKPSAFARTYAEHLKNIEKYGKK